MAMITFIPINQKYMWPIMMIYIGVLCTVYGVVWIISRYYTNDITESSSISLICRDEILPKTLGPNDIINVLNLTPTSIANGGRDLAEIFGSPGKEWQWTTNSDGLFRAAVSKCEITNYGPFPLLGFEMVLDLYFYEAVTMQDQPNGIAKGRLNLRRPWPVSVQKIDIGPEHKFVFYMYNQTRDMIANVVLPKTAMVRYLGDSKMHEIRLDVPNYGGEVPLVFPPLTPWSPDQSRSNK